MLSLPPAYSTATHSTQHHTADLQAGMGNAATTQKALFSAGMCCSPLKLDRALSGPGAVCCSPFKLDRAVSHLRCWGEVPACARGASAASSDPL